MCVVVSSVLSEVVHYNLFNAADRPRSQLLTGEWRIPPQDIQIKSGTTKAPQDVQIESGTTKAPETGRSHWVTQAGIRTGTGVEGY